MNLEKSKFKFHHEDRCIEVFSDGRVTLTYLDDDSYNEWEIKRDILQVGQNGKLIWIEAKDGVEYCLDCNLSLLLVHQK